jgi:hypothetical protein
MDFILFVWNSFLGVFYEMKKKPWVVPTFVRSSVCPSFQQLPHMSDLPLVAFS